MDPILLVGATGETGRKILRYACARGVRIAAAARSCTAAEATLRPHFGPIGIRHLDATDAKSIEAALTGVSVLINATTPAGAHSLNLIPTCIKKRIQYVDISGEVSSVLRIIEQFDRDARDHGVTLIAGAGYGGTVGEVATRLALDELQRLHPEQRATEGLVVYETGDFTPTAGTLQSEADTIIGPVPVIRDGRVVVEHSTGEIVRPFGVPIVMRPMTDAVLVSRYARLKEFRAGPTFPEKMLETLAGTFRSMASELRVPAARAAYLQGIPAGSYFEERPYRGIVTAYLASDAGRQVRVALRTGPVYDTTARIALSIAQALAGDNKTPRGVQAPSTVLPSIQDALVEWGVERLA